MKKWILGILICAVLVSAVAPPAEAGVLSVFKVIGKVALKGLSKGGRVVKTVGVKTSSVVRKAGNVAKGAAKVGSGVVAGEWIAGTAKKIVGNKYVKATVKYGVPVFGAYGFYKLYRSGFFKVLSWVIVGILAFAILAFIFPPLYAMLAFGIRRILNFRAKLRKKRKEQEASMQGASCYERG